MTRSPTLPTPADPWGGGQGQIAADHLASRRQAYRSKKYFDGLPRLCPTTVGSRLRPPSCLALYCLLTSAPRLPGSPVSLCGELHATSHLLSYDHPESSGPAMRTPPPLLFSVPVTRPRLFSSVLGILHLLPCSLHTGHTFTSFSLSFQVTEQMSPCQKASSDIIL